MVSAQYLKIFDISLPNLVHRSTRARQRPSMNWWPWPYFQGQEGHLEWFCSISEGIFDRVSRNLIDRSTKARWRTRFECRNHDLVFKVTKVIWNGFYSISEMYLTVSTNSVHRSTRAMQRTSTNRVTVTNFWRSRSSFMLKGFPLNILRNIQHGLSKFRTRIQCGKA